MKSTNKVLSYLKKAYSLHNTPLSEHAEGRIVFEVTKNNIVELAKMIQREELKNENRRGNIQRVS